jgi:formylglycine-generating enzyme required for sulfatase activity
MPTQQPTSPLQNLPHLGLFLSCFRGEPLTVRDVTTVAEWQHLIHGDLDTLAGGLMAEGYLKAVPPPTPHGPRLAWTPLGESTCRTFLVRDLPSADAQAFLLSPFVTKALDWILLAVGPDLIGSAAHDRLGTLAKEERTARLPFEPQIVYVPAGPFTMGTSDAEIELLARHYRWVQSMREDHFFDYEQPQHQVTLAAYWIGRYPVTNRQYGAFIRDTDSEPPRHWADGRPPGDRLDHPATNVSWHQARAYLAWLGTQSGRPYRLPTEAEWEKAARGTDGRIWPWGNQPPDASRCNYGDWRGDTTPVGRYSPTGDSPCGCADMAGNVWEWCRNLHSLYPYDPSDGREEIDDPGPRAMRGGAFNLNEYATRCASELRRFPKDRSKDLGFRVVMAPLPASP